MNCKECGARINKSTGCCEACGAPVATYFSDSTYNFNSPYAGKVTPENDPYYDKYQTEPKVTIDGNVPQAGPRTLTFDPTSVEVERVNITLYVLLEIITFDLFGIYWRYRLNRDLKKLTGDVTSPSGALFVLLIMFSMGIYDFSWQYLMGENVDLLRNKVVGAKGIVYTLRRLFLLHIFNFIDMQKTINSFAKEK